MTGRQVPFFLYPKVFLEHEERFIDIFRDVGRRGAFILQRDLEEFEAQIAEYTCAAHTVGVANATDGLQLALLAGGITPGDELIICSHTMIATASAVHFAGGVPVPVETGPDHLIDLESVEAATTERTRAIMPTQLNGRTANMDQLRDMADRHHLDIYEDAAQALGSKYKGRCAGTFGVASSISFYPAKTLGCFGDGGVILTNDDDVWTKLLLLRDHGQGDDRDVKLWGVNSRLDNLQAAILKFKLESYDACVERRRGLASAYQRRLAGCPQLVLPPGPDADDEYFDVYQNYEIEAEDRDGLRVFLRDQGVGTTVQWGGKAVHQFRALGFSQTLPKTESMFTRMLLLPMYPYLASEDVGYVCDTILRFYARRGSCPGGGWEQV